MVPITIADLRAGRNGIDSPLDPNFPANQCVEARNIEFSDNPCGAKRGGSDLFNFSSGATGGYQFLYRHVPGGDEGLAELWACGGDKIIRRFVGGVWTAPTMVDAMTGSPLDCVGVTLNGKLFLFYQSAVSRCHVWDPNLAIPKIRRVGMAAPPPPTVADFGVGAYPAVLRYYRVRYVQVTGGRIIRRSEPSTSVAFTPFGGGISAQVSRGALINEDETHWEVEASTDNVTFVQIAFVNGPGFGLGDPAIAITTGAYSDGQLIAAYGNLPVADPVGRYALFPSMKYATTDGNRLIGAGSWNPSSDVHQSRVWYSLVLGSLDTGDDEHWVNQSTLKTRTDLAESNGGDIRGISPTINGVFWVGKLRQVWRFTPTTDLTQPYVPRQLSGIVGFVSHHSVIQFEDANGAPHIGFISHRGPYRIGINGLESMGRDIEDFWRGFGGYAGVKVNLSADRVAHGVYHSDKSQAYWWVATGANAVPNARIRVDIKQATREDRFGIRGGWIIDDGQASAAYCSALFANSFIAGARATLDLKPHCGIVAGTTDILKCDTAALDDSGVPFQGFIVTRSLADISNKLVNVVEPLFVAKTQSPSTMTCKVVTDFGRNPAVPRPLIFDPVAAETRTIQKAEGVTDADAFAIQLQYGDAAPALSLWAVDTIIVPMSLGGER